MTECLGMRPRGSGTVACCTVMRQGNEVREEKTVAGRHDWVCKQDKVNQLTQAS